MTKDKQIEEMAFNLIMATSPLGVKDLTKQFDYKTVATDLYELYGWRKATDVAREIFEEIEEIAMHSITSFGLQTMVMGEVAFAELKKKYTESENNDG